VRPLAATFGFSADGTPDEMRDRFSLSDANLATRLTNVATDDAQATFGSIAAASSVWMPIGRLQKNRLP
ncbi:hypothetical protein LCGC14_2018140, partial [marine sediment metagenome]